MTNLRQILASEGLVAKTSSNRNSSAFPDRENLKALRGLMKPLNIQIATDVNRILPGIYGIGFWVPLYSDLPDPISAAKRAHRYLTEAGWAVEYRSPGKIFVPQGASKDSASLIIYAEGASRLPSSYATSSA